MADWYTINGFPRWRYYTDDEGTHFDGFTRVWCAWSDRVAVVSEFGSNPGNQYPAAYGDGPTAAIVREIRCKPHGWQKNEDTNLSDYDGAVLDIKYSTKGPLWVSDMYLEEYFGPFSSEVTAPGKKLSWGRGGLTLGDHDVSKKLYGGVYTVKFGNVSVEPPGLWGYVGYINANTVASYTRTKTFAPETLLYTLPTITNNFSFDRGQRISIEYKYLWWPWGWNNEWRPEAAVNNNLGAAFQQPWVINPELPFIKYPATDF